MLLQIVNPETMRIIWSYLVFLGLPFSGFAQSLAPRVVGSGGVDASVGAFRFSGVVGEPVAATYGGSGHFLTVGFEQPFPVSAPLPLEWLAFSGRFVNGQVELEWVTGREYNTDRFDVERSADGRRFDKISQVAAAGNPTAATTYRTVDGSPLSGKNYYRIRQVDVDGRSSYSVVVLVETSGLAGWSVYPNPAHGHFALEIRSAAARTIVVYLYSWGGQLMASRQVACMGGRTVIEWDVPGLSGGLYVLRAGGNELAPLLVRLL
jgi:hypothetical protein